MTNAGIRGTIYKIEDFSVLWVWLWQVKKSNIMIRVTIELVPGGDESRKVRIAGADIANITALAKLSDYDASMFEDASPITGKPAIVYRHQISGHNREQSVWALIEKVAAGWVNIDHDAVVLKSIEGHGG